MLKNRIKNYSKHYFLNIIYSNNESKHNKLKEYNANKGRK